MMSLWPLFLAAALAACQRPSDEAVLRAEFDIPPAATVVTYRAVPEEAGWFGREGLKIDLVFQLNDGDFARYVATAEAGGDWRPLPIPREFLMHMGGIHTAKAGLLRSYTQRDQPPPPEGSVYNPTKDQLFERFCETLPLEIRHGWYQCRSAGDDIMHRPKTVQGTLDRELNDFMLAVLDADTQQIVIRVSTSY
ncbi:MAG: hypothetical protein JXQ27_19095 [Acidobacteria bacterium]|nr:hypothetical protein [Acidobacteriota bacterium]